MSDELASPDILYVLENALTAHDAGDFTNALKFYEQFFDHALDDDPYALYAVKFTHGLAGWLSLAEVFPGAKRSLEHKRLERKQSYQENKQVELFHDYWEICQGLGLEDEALDFFLEHHYNNPKSAAKLSKYVWDHLVLKEHWRVCDQLLPEPAQKLDELFSIFDESLSMRELDSQFDNVKFDTHIVNTLLDDLNKVIMVLRQASRYDELDQLQRQFMLGAKNRQHALLDKQVHARASFLFATH